MLDIGLPDILGFEVCRQLKADPSTEKIKVLILSASYLEFEDRVEGLLAAAEASDLDGRTIDLGSGTLVSIRDIVLRLVQLVKAPVEPLFGALPPRPSEMVRAADTSNAYAKLGWKPMTLLDEGLELTVNWYRAQLDTKR